MPLLSQDEMVTPYVHENVPPQPMSWCTAGSAERVSVVRHAFAAHNADHEPLSNLVAALGEGRVAVAHEASQPHRRLIVDEYVAGPDGHYQLQKTGTDLFRSALCHECFTCCQGCTASGVASTVVPVSIAGTFDVFSVVKADECSRLVVHMQVSQQGGHSSHPRA
jgi:hypothetical protein